MHNSSSPSPSGSYIRVRPPLSFVVFVVLVVLGVPVKDMEREVALGAPGATGVMTAAAPAKLDAVGAEVDTI